jgi:crossover junction endodeoxyribonuclease RuvC
MIIAGIDPGKSGALAITYPDGAVQVLDVPTIKLRGKDVPAWHDWQRSWSMLLEFSGPDLIVIEDVSARPGQGVTSMFTFGRTLGFVHALAVATKASVQMVTPAVWKGKLGLLNSSKGASREKARGLYPRSVDLLNRIKDDGRAEAILLAHYGRKYL